MGVALWIHPTRKAQQRNKIGPRSEPRGMRAGPRQPLPTASLGRRSVQAPCPPRPRNRAHSGALLPARRHSRRQGVHGLPQRVLLSALALHQLPDAGLPLRVPGHPHIPVGHQCALWRLQGLLQGEHRVEWSHVHEGIRFECRAHRRDVTVVRGHGADGRGGGGRHGLRGDSPVRQEHAVLPDVLRGDTLRACNEHADEVLVL